MPSAVPLRPFLLSAAVLASLTSVAQAQAPVLAPHRAVYELKLDDRRASGGLEQARGRILFETTGNRCEGYTTNFRQVVELTMNGNRVVMDARTAHFEEGDGSGFRFTSRATQNGAPYMETDGSANRATDAVAVRLRKPREGTQSLDRAVIFPTEHLLRMMEAARDGRTILEAKVYDGAETGDRVYDATAIIGRRMEGEPQEAEPAARDPRLAGLPRWPVTISYFEQGKDGGTPAYSLAFELYENGVSRRMVINYPEFSLRGELIQLDWQAATPCERP
jgi:hypothetical protein